MASNLLADVDLTLALMGCPCLSELGRQNLVETPLGVGPVAPEEPERTTRSGENVSSL